MNNTKKIRNISRFLRYSSVAGIVCLPLVNACYWAYDGFRQFYVEKTQWLLKFTVASRRSLEDLTRAQKIDGFLTDLIPYFFMTIIFATMIKLLRQFDRLDFFSEKTIAYIQRIGFMIILNLIFQPFYIGLQRYVIAEPASIDYGLFFLAFGPNEFFLFFLGIVIFLFARIMEEGRRLQEENSTTI